MAKVTENIVNEVENVMEEKVETVEFVALSLDEIKDKITIKKKIGVLAKQEIVKVVYDSCVKKDDANGVYYLDRIMGRVAYDFAVLSNYTDFYSVIENAPIYTYDYLDEIGLFDYVLENMTDDIDSVSAAIDDFESRVAALNSVGACLHRIVGEGFKNMPTMSDFRKLLKEIPKVLNSVDKDVIKTFAGEFKNGNIINIANAKKKD